MGEKKEYVVYGMKAKCSEGTMENYLSTDVGHGVVYKGQPVLNANDHQKGVNLTHFGDCNSKKIYEDAKKEADEKYKAEEGDGFFAKAGKWIAKTATKAVISVQEHLMFHKCELDTPLPWNFTNSEHMIDGAPALTMESQCTCRYGGIISIVPNVSSANLESENIETVEDKTAKEINAYEQMLQEKYGFDAEQASLISNSYQLFMSNEKVQKMSRKEQLHQYFSAMAGLCINYSGDAIRWEIISDTMSTTEAMDYFVSLGMSQQDVFDLMGGINFQHSEGKLLTKASDYNSQGFCSNKDCDRNCGYKYHITDSKYWKFDYGDAATENDFAHELIQYATFSNDASPWHHIWNYFGIFGNIDNMVSFKGDIYSTRMEPVDMHSDMDAVNLYQRFENSDKSILELMVEYNEQVSDGTLNRAEEFLKNLGDGDAEAGYEELKRELDDVDVASQYISQGSKAFSNTLQDGLWYYAITGSGAASLGEDTMEELLEKTNRSKVGENKDINEVKEKFLDYVYDEWKNENK